MHANMNKYRLRKCQKMGRPCWARICAAVVVLIEYLWYVTRTQSYTKTKKLPNYARYTQKPKCSRRF